MKYWQRRFPPNSRVREKTERQPNPTESILGPYVVHDFFLYHHLRNGFGPRKLYELAKIAFAEDYTAKDLKNWLMVFFDRGYKSQFKRTTLPPGPKVGSW